MSADADEFEEFDDLPEFANEANRALHRQLKEHEKAVVVVESELVETKERIGTMNEHLTSVNTEQLHTQRLVDAKIKEIETEVRPRCPRRRPLAPPSAMPARGAPASHGNQRLLGTGPPARRCSPTVRSSACPRAPSPPPRAYSLPSCDAGSPEAAGGAGARPLPG